MARGTAAGAGTVGGPGSGETDGLAMAGASGTDPASRPRDATAASMVSASGASGMAR